MPLTPTQVKTQQATYNTAEVSKLLQSVDVALAGHTWDYNPVMVYHISKYARPSVVAEIIQTFNECGWIVESKVTEICYQLKFRMPQVLEVTALQVAVKIEG